jgi:catechol 2,3-dioxygenase-like lactoylglutathione lyase family enzyme
MSIRLGTVGVIAKDMARTLDFYRTLGLDIPPAAADEDNVEVPVGNSATLGFLTEKLARAADPNYESPTGSSLNLQFELESPVEVDAKYRVLIEAGYEAYAEPWDAFWGQRFARVKDPDSRVVNLYANLH